MQHETFFSRIRHFSHLSLCTFLVFFALSVQADKNQCPKIDSHETVALKFQLFSAFQTGFDGYEAPCELKCFGNSDCKNRCQSKKGLEYLSKQMLDIKHKRDIEQCSSLTLACLEQCQPMGASCAQVCDGSVQVGSTSASTR